MKYNTNEIYCFDDFIRRGRGQASENFPGKIKNRIKNKSPLISQEAICVAGSIELSNQYIKDFLSIVEFNTDIK